MDTSVLLLVLFVFTLLCCLALLRRAARAPAAVQLPTIEISDAAVARRALVDYADVFANRPFLPFPVALVTGRRRRRSDNLTSVPYGPHWRVLRRNLTAGIFHPSRLGLLAPLQRDAVDDLVAGISESAAGGAVPVVVRDVAYAAVFRLAARMCFGDGVGERQVRALRRVIREFVLDVGVANNVFPVSTSTALARLRRWRRIRRLLSSRRRQAELYLPLIDERRRRMAARRRDRDDDGGTFRPYVDALIALRVPGDGESTPAPLTDDEMVSLLMEFLAASTETVVSCIEWTLAHLVLNAEAQSKLRREVGDGEHVHGRHRGRTLYMRAVILESLRLHPPVPFVIREVVGGAGARVRVDAGGWRRGPDAAGRLLQRDADAAPGARHATTTRSRVITFYSLCFNNVMIYVPSLLKFFEISAVFPAIGYDTCQHLPPPASGTACLHSVRVSRARGGFLFLHLLLKK